MGLYARHLCPCLLDWVMAAPQFAELRPQVLRHARGNVFEIGFGSGHNLSHYPGGITKLTTADPNERLNQIAQKRIHATPFAVETHLLGAEDLPMADSTFDTVVSTWTLCSVAGVEQALSELRRILKPDGRFLFVEHGLADDPRAQWWQHALTPVQRMVADGCHLNRDIKALISNSGFRIETLENFRIRHMPKWIGYQYKGIAVKG
ncbi:MAG: class I SAM-dependent methyltransferase [Candidatus Hydrogenedentes bacterium]|nr:class I SAM-dependent methyltransferase [Candidatus Hydrogenedentota bacterium]